MDKKYKNIFRPTEEARMAFLIIFIKIMKN